MKGLHKKKLKTLAAHDAERRELHEASKKRHLNGIACPLCGAELYDINPDFTPVRCGAPLGELADLAKGVPAIILPPDRHGFYENIVPSILLPAARLEALERIEKAAQRVEEATADSGWSTLHGCVSMSATPEHGPRELLRRLTVLFDALALAALRDGTTQETK